jgi:hypothetical protein
LGLLIGILTISWQNRGLAPIIPDPNFPGAEGQMIYTLGLAPLLAVGWLLTARATANPYGWLWLVLAFLTVTQQFVQALADNLLRSVVDLAVVLSGPEGYVAGTGSTFRTVQWLGLAGDYLWAAGIVVLAFILLLFPDGRLPSPRWRWVARLIGWGFALMVGLGWIGGGGVSGTVPVEYPQPIVTLSSTAGEILLFILDGVLVVGILLGVAAGAFSVIVRYRRSHGVERQQIKWVMLAGFLFVPTIFWDAPGLWDPAIEAIVTGSVPVAAAIAVTRYRLYEIDRILSRTVAYGLVVGLLAAVYSGGIFLLQQLLPQQSDLVVAATTLAVAALFNPVRLRMLASVDRRFNRARYDAEQVVVGFSNRLREEVDIDLVASDVGAIVGQVLQPNRLSLWIRRLT